jgi:hypothetical protein
MICRYEELVHRPADVMRGLYQFAGVSYPGDHIVRDVHSRSVGNKDRSRQSAAVREQCEEMLGRLDACHAQTWSGAIYRDATVPQPAFQSQKAAPHGNSY